MRFMFSARVVRQSGTLVLARGELSKEPNLSTQVVKEKETNYFRVNSRWNSGRRWLSKV